jgi:3-hydroxymyristoyl/3-hydroxydecanoyl-(acyl carrier protein) dehydratase
MPSEDETRHVATMRVARTHPALPGHFPGNPIVPGVMVLEEVIRAAEGAAGQPLHVRSVPVAKFLTPLRPDVEATIELVRRGSTWSFHVVCGTATVAKGVLTAEPVVPA